MDAPGNPGREQPKCLLVSAQVVHDEVDSASGPEREHVFQPECEALSGRFARKSFANGPAGMRAESREPLEGSVALVAVWAALGSLSPSPASPWDCLQGAHFVEADNLAPSRRMAVDTNYSVFFTSNSGSSLSHHV
jgi:hypothetical protein